MSLFYSIPAGVVWGMILAFLYLGISESWWYKKLRNWIAEKIICRGKHEYRREYASPDPKLDNYYCEICKKEK